MKKRLSILIALILCITVMFSFASCTGTTGDEENETEFVAATLPVSDSVPVSESEIIAFYNDMVANLQKADMFDESNKPGIKLNESLSADNIQVLAYNAATGEATESDTLTTLNKSAKAIKNRIIGGIETDSTVVGFGDTDVAFSTIFYPYNGESNLTSDNVINAACSVNGSSLNIKITLAGNADTVNNVFGIRDKAAVLENINEASSAYATVNDYAVEYVADEENNTYSTIEMSVEVEQNDDGAYVCTGRIMSMKIRILCDVSANITCVGSFADYGDLQVNFRFTDEKSYEFDWLGTATWEPAAVESATE